MRHSALGCPNAPTHRVRAQDLALLRLSSPIPAELGALALGAVGSVGCGVPVLAVGNPYDWDLEVCDAPSDMLGVSAQLFPMHGRVAGSVSNVVSHGHRSL